jgi:GR25 family glycosyltransferase involved in LPS biosynthesis
MISRFSQAGLLDNVTWIKATPAGAKILDYYAQDLNRKPTTTHNTDGIYGCLLSHLRAIRKFVKTGDSECIICEDDILFHQDFRNQYQDVYANVPSDAPLVMLSYIVAQWDFKWGGNDHRKENLCQMTEGSTWGTQIYLIRRSYAIKCLSKYDRPFKEIPRLEDELLTSELITRKSLGMLVYPPLAIEDSVRLLNDNNNNQKNSFNDQKNSDLRCDVMNQARAFARWGVHNYQS